MDRLPRIPAAVLWALAGATALYVSPLMPSDPPVSYSEVIVPAARIVEQEPDTVRTFVDRVVYRTVEPETVARSEEPAGEPEVASFCAEFARARADSVRNSLEDSSEAHPSPERSPRRLLLRSGSHDAGFLWRADHLTLTGPTSDGHLQQQSYELRPGFSFRTSGDSVIVRSPRFWWLREGAEAGVLVGIGYLLGQVF